MVSGGARARSGPAPDPNALRRDRKDDAGTWVTLPRERTGPAPEWPLTSPPTPTEEAHWRKHWAMPQATEWEKEGPYLAYEVALYIRNLVQTEIAGAPVGLIKEVRQVADSLGLTRDGLLKARWRIAQDPNTKPATGATTPSAARPARRGPSSRDRFRVVPPVEE